MHITDMFGRPLRDLRISVTDRCNFRCTYCMPKEKFGPDYPFLGQAQLLSFDEIYRLSRILVGQGVKKIRLTGGEPLMRHNLEHLVERLAHLPGVELAMTTNGALLRQKAEILKRAGLDRVTVSLDSLDEETFARMNGVNYPLSKVLQGIKAAKVAGLTPIKVNMVVKRGLNEESILPMARYFYGTDYILRFIEYMDVGTSNGWQLRDVVPAAEIIARINAEMPLEPLDPNYRGEVATRWRYRDGAGEVGIIASVTQPFCGDCSRVRISAEGKLYTCLFASQGHDFRQLLRNGASDAEILRQMTAIWQHRSDRYSEIRSTQTCDLAKVEMSYIGG